MSLQQGEHSLYTPSGMTRDFTTTLCPACYPGGCVTKGPTRVTGLDTPFFPAPHPKVALTTRLVGWRPSHQGEDLARVMVLPASIPVVPGPLRGHKCFCPVAASLSRESYARRRPAAGPSGTPRPTLGPNDCSPACIRVGFPCQFPA